MKIIIPHSVIVGTATATLDTEFPPCPTPPFPPDAKVKVPVYVVPDKLDPLYVISLLALDVETEESFQLMTMLLGSLVPSIALIEEDGSQKDMLAVFPDFP